MSEIQIPNKRRYGDIHFRLSVTDSGVPISWDSTEIKRLFMYSEKQRGFGGKCSFRVDTDPHYLNVTFAAYNQQFLGIHRVVVQLEVHGNVATYDARVCNIVASTSNEPVNYDDVIDVPIEVSEVDTTVLHEILEACRQATGEANDAAERAGAAVAGMLGGRKNEVLTKLSDEPLHFGWKPPQGSGARPYVSLERLRRFLYRVSFDVIPELGGEIAPVMGGCSAYVQDGKLHRNLDFKFDNAASFIVRTRDFEGMSFITGLDDGEMDDELIAQLPYRVVDGRNNHGIMVSVHVLFNDWQYTGAGSKSIPLTRLPFEVLTRVKSMDTIAADLNGVLDNLAVTEAMAGYLLQVLVTDGTTTYAVIPPTSDNQGYELVNATSFPKMSNFRYVARAEVSRFDMDLQTRPTGIERFNLMPCPLEGLRFTKAYEAADRLSEFIGIDETTKASTDAELEAIYALAHAEYLVRERDGKTWQTMHSVVYGDRMEHLYIQEDWSDDIVASGVSKEYVDGEIERVENEMPTKTSDLINDSDFQTEVEVSAAVSVETSRAEAAEALIEGDIDAIEQKIPEQASSSNKLADKAFVNSSVQTAAANFRGNWATTSAIPTDYTLYPADYAGNKKPTTNDYLVVQADESKDGGTWRYKYTGDWDTDGVSGWNAEYEVNETPLTAAQLAALNSGITAGKVEEIAGKYVKPQTGIPSTDMTTEVQTTLGKVTELEQEVNDLAELSPIVLSDTTMTSELFDELWETEKTALIGVGEGSQMFSCFAKECLPFVRPSSQGIIEGKGILLYYWNNVNQIVKITCERVNGETEVTVTITVYKDLADFLTSDKIATTINHQSVNTKVAGALATYQAIHPAFVASIPASGAESNKVYRLGTVTGAVVISLATPADNTVDNYWHFTFTTDANITSVTWPSTMNGWVGNCLENGAPKIVASKHYEVDIDIEGYGFITEF